MDDEARLRRAMRLPAGASSDFDLNPGTVLKPGRTLRPAAVLVPVLIDEGRVLLTKRSSQLKHHPGQVAFPGGKVDDGDDGPDGAALREAWEEVGLPPARVEILGHMPPHETITGFLVTPIVGLIRGDFAPLPEAGEVEEAFAVPLHHVLTPGNFAIEGRMWRGVRRRYYAVPWGPYYIWGATARILRGLAERFAA
jgi:8-oxo-dGTP pyrophosphatase MutT (NUDIX family)